MRNLSVELANLTKKIMLTLFILYDWNNIFIFMSGHISK